MVDNSLMQKQNSPVFDPNSNPSPVGGANWSDIWQDWAWHSQENDIWSTSGEIQFSEWSQQMLATMYQNWYNSEPEKMKRAIDAGINPFVAASGISGGSPTGIASAPPQTPAGSPALSALGSAASAFGGAFSGVANASSVLAKLRPEIRKIDTETAYIFKQMGFSDLQSTAMSIQLKYLDEKEQIGVWQALASFNKTSQEYHNLVEMNKNIIAQYDEIIAHKDLLIQERGEIAAREEYEKAMKAKVEQESRWQKIENEFFEAHGYKLGTPLYEGLRDMMVSNGSFDMNEFGNTVAGYNGKITNAVEAAKAVNSWYYRPSTVSEAAAYLGNTAGIALRNLIMNSNDVTSWSQLSMKLKTDVNASREFNEAYSNAREDLYEEYLSKKRYYRNIRRGGNTQEVARAKMAMETAYQNYQSLTKENFGDELIKSISPK